MVVIANTYLVFTPCQVLLYDFMHISEFYSS